MKLSTKALYGTRAILDLALHHGNKLVLLKDIAKRQGISERYLEHIMVLFVSGGLVQSMRGRQGGFALARPPKEIHLSQVIEVVEGSFAPVRCVDNPKWCRRSTVCVTREIWEKLKETMLTMLNSITLEDMVKMQKKKVMREEGQIYYI